MAEAGLLAQPKRAARGCATAAAERFGCGCFGGREVPEAFGAAVVDADSVLRTVTRQRKMRTHVPTAVAPDGRVAATKGPAAQNTAWVSASAACMRARNVRHASRSAGKGRPPYLVLPAFAAARDGPDPDA